jgi:hypothetical protein
VRIDELHGRMFRSPESASPPALELSEAAPSSLGVLDQIDDSPTRSPRLQLRSPPTPPPVELPRAPLPYSSAADIALAQKIAQLQALMADTDVRHVLAGLSGSPLTLS